MSDRMALDPLASTGDPVQRLIARVAELERTVEALRNPPTLVKTVANNPSTFKVFTTAGPNTYTASGGKVLVIATGLASVDAASGDVVLRLLIDGVQRDIATVEIKPEGRVTQPLVSPPILAFAPGTWTGDHTVQVALVTGSGLQNTRTVVLELPIGS